MAGAATMTDGTIHYRAANEGDADALAALFRETFCETFGHLYKPEDLAAFLAGHDVGRWTGQLCDPAYAVQLAEDDALVGFAKLGPLKLPVEDPMPALELHQLYVCPRVRGAGVADTLMEWAISEARSRDAEELYLSVYTDNIRAQRFYARRGFVAVGPCVFMVGNQQDNDIIMRCRLV